MTLDEAIKHCKEKAEELRKQVDTHIVVDAEEIGDCIECANEHEQLAEWLKELKELRESKPQGDLISREALLFEIRQQLAFQKEKAKFTTINADKMTHNMVATGIQLAIDIIENAPTVEPTFGLFRTMLCDTCQAYATNRAIAKLADEYTRPHGKWNIEHDWVHCSSCGHEQNYPSNFCPYCGADMRGKEE